MGWFFNRKSKKIEEAKPKVCRHQWKDFPWYYKATYFTAQQTLKAKIIEPYVCIHCKERKDVILKEINTQISYEDAKKQIDTWRNDYKDYMMDETIINDMIADMQLVDREYLALAEAITNPPKTFENDPLDTEIKELQKVLKDLEKDFSVSASQTVTT